MAIVIRKRGDSWRAEVRFRQHYKGQMFVTKREAKGWAEQIQSEFYTLEGNTKGLGVSKKTLKDLLTRYGAEVSVKKKGYRAERARLLRRSNVVGLVFSTLSKSLCNCLN